MSRSDRETGTRSHGALSDDAKEFAAKFAVSEAELAGFADDIERTVERFDLVPSSGQRLSHRSTIGTGRHGTPLYSPAMTNVDEQGRPEPPVAGDEIATVLGFLEFQRATLAWKCAELDAAGLRARVGASSMTLGGMLKHLASVEDWWFSQCLHGRGPERPWDTVDWDADPDWDWHSAADDAPEQLHGLWREAVARSRALVAEALAHGDLDQLSRGPARKVPRSLRWIVLHMIEEYARHNGHADLLRESVDGLTGE